MAEYIEKEKLIDFVNKYIPNIHRETTMDCVIRAINRAPTEDVVPRNEVAKEFTCVFGTPHKVSECPINDEVDKAKQEVARAILDEISKRFEVLLKDYPCEGYLVSAKKFLDFHWKYIVNSIMADYKPNSKRKK